MYELVNHVADFDTVARIRMSALPKLLNGLGCLSKIEP